MSKIELFVLKEDLPKTIGILHNLGLLHIEQLHLSKIMEQRGISRVPLSAEQEKEKTHSETPINQINALIEDLGHLAKSCLEDLASVKEDLQTKSTPELIEIVFKRIKPRFDSLAKDLDALNDELGILPQYKQILESFLLSKREVKMHQDLSCLALIFDRRYEKDMQIFKKHLEEKTKTKIELYIAVFSPKKIVSLLFYPSQISSQIDAQIFKKGTIKIELPAKYLSRTLEETIKSIEARISQIPNQIEKLNRALFDFAKENIPLICTIKTIVLNRLDQIQVLNNFLASKYTVAITGWLPTRDLGYLTSQLEQSLEKNFALYERTRFVKHPQHIPVLLENPKRIRPFELLLGLLPPPKYGTRDATGLLSIFFPIFFGLIVGDIGYGIIFLVISLFLKRSVKVFISSIGSILFAVSLSSIFFGILYGEFFGNLGRDYFRLPHILFDRHESILPFLILAVSVGAFHIVLGFVLGIIGAIHERHKKEVIEKASILGGLVGLFLLVGSMVKILPSRFLPFSIVLLVVVTILLIMSRGFLGPLEAISAVANILSYARIMALGLAGVMMASIANRIGGMPENVLIGIILACLLHALNLVLSVFSPTIQSLRLHYVEFFSKFYEPGGKKYSPFRKREVTECIS